MQHTAVVVYPTRGYVAGGLRGLLKAHLRGGKHASGLLTPLLWCMSSVESAPTRGVRPDTGELDRTVRATRCDSMVRGYTCNTRRCYEYILPVYEGLLHGVSGVPCGTLCGPPCGVGNTPIRSTIFLGIHGE